FCAIRLSCSSLFLSSHPDHLPLHSFPTRRSSDLCVLTHGTAGLSFVALLFSDSDLIRTFGEAGFLATIIALLAVLTLVPLLGVLDRKSTRVNSSHLVISYAVFCLKKKSVTIDIKI